jgi:hypothetical protein
MVITCAFFKKGPGLSGSYFKRDTLVTGPKATKTVKHLSKKFLQVLRFVPISQKPVSDCILRGGKTAANPNIRGGTPHLPCNSRLSCGFSHNKCSSSWDSHCVAIRSWHIICLAGFQAEI